ncbi:vacuolar calcium ion transporter [Emericellopsis cladophorae]|uniref:Vacuolar calcium ion transporter n=1 Tax=Emericellopsis cladophorae TaxID=2686198 RepID=A0A9P9XVT7_9HYPO|nr:vacuolar calcium ion transporter [Emericellopsis cladophorae]KAI6778518.1 vacuolar calcium ion transporter [Emericellopsis cladophorae]
MPPNVRRTQSATHNILGARSRWKQAAKVRRTLAPRANTDSGLEAGLRHGYTEPTDYKPQNPTHSQNGGSDRTLDGTPSSAEVNTSPQANGDALRNRRSNGKAEEDSETTTKYEAKNAKNKSDKLQKKNSHRFYRPVHPREPFTVSNQIRRTLLGSWLNILLLAAPAGIAVGAAGLDGRIVFGVNFVAIVPLAAMLSDATEEVALRTGESIGGLINATFGNAVELIVAIIALTKGKVAIVQTSLIGSILSNLLLVLGCCFLAGGYRRREQYFNTTVVDSAASLLILSVAGLIVPTVFKENPTFEDRPGTAALSRGVAVILFFVYAAFLVFQLHTHSADFAVESQKVEPESLWRRRKDANVMLRQDPSQGSLGEKEDEDDDSDEAEPELHFSVALGVLAIATVIIAFCAEYMVGGISAITDAGGISEEFVGLILLPIVGNAAEHVTAVKVAYKDKMDLSIGVAIGSSIQVALFVVPLLVIIGWGMGVEDMTLAFDMFQVAVMFVSVLLVNYLIGDGKSNWLEGVMLVCLYLAIAVCSWWYPATGVAG